MVKYSTLQNAGRISTVAVYPKNGAGALAVRSAAAWQDISVQVLGY
jgi:hypothetical protein